MAQKNVCGKSVKMADAKTKAYDIYTDGVFTYYVLKHYKSPEAERNDPYARVFCGTVRPHTFGSLELGDGYLCDVKRGTFRLGGTFDAETNTVGEMKFIEGFDPSTLPGRV